jgi:hypothetical protein
MKVILTVDKCPTKRGYSIFHNQPKGWKGVISNWFGWYKYKSDAIAAKDELQKYYDKTEVTA